MTATSKASWLLFLGRCRLFSACPRLETVEELGRGPTAKQWEDLRDENLLDSRANRGRCGRLSAVGGSPGWATCSQCSPAQPHKPQAPSSTESGAEARTCTRLQWRRADWSARPFRRYTTRRSSRRSVRSSYGRNPSGRPAAAASAQPVLLRCSSEHGKRARNLAYE